MSAGRSPDKNRIFLSQLARFDHRDLRRPPRFRRNRRPDDSPAVLRCTAQNSGQVVNIDVNDNQTLRRDVNGVMSGGGDFIVPTKRGIGTLTLSGNNTFDVRDFVNASRLTSNDGIRLEGGILRVAHSNALGTTPRVHRS